LHPDSGRFAGWRVGERDLDEWLAERGATPLVDRLPVLVYGSNRCPSKITWLRRQLGLTGPVVVLAARTENVAAVWASGLRKRDGQRTAVLAAAPGVTEQHALWLATPDQVEVLDVCEGRGHRYRLARLGPDTPIRTEDGALVEQPWCYLGLGLIRRPLLVGDSGGPGGRPVRCTELAQAEAAALVGLAATGDGLTATEGTGGPAPEQWPDVLFGYGRLQPGRSGWPLLEPHAAGPSRPATALGAVYHTGLGWPAMQLDPAGRTPGTLTPLRAPTELLPTLDRYQGPDYRRVRITLTDHTVAWAYAWIGDRTGLRPSPRAPQDLVAS
jgi:gamma-glutamylcyclotransferase (GGCT)/AIG2-like uncharacterized protein YtfP